MKRTHGQTLTLLSTLFLLMCSSKAKETFVVGPDGATFHSADGKAMIHIPAGAMEIVHTFTIEPKAVPQVYGKSYFATTGVYEIKPSYQFKKPVTVSLVLDIGKIQSLSLTKAKSMGFVDSQSSAEANSSRLSGWHGKQSQVSGDRLVITTSHFSTFGGGTPVPGNLPPNILGAFYYFKPGCDYLPYRVRSQVQDPEGDALTVTLLVAGHGGSLNSVPMVREGVTDWYHADITYQAMLLGGILIQVLAVDSAGNNTKVPQTPFLYPTDTGNATYISGFKIDKDNDGYLDAWEVDNGFNPGSPASPSGITDTDGDGIPDAADHTPNGELNPLIDNLSIDPTIVVLAIGESVPFSVSASFGGQPRFVQAIFAATGFGSNGQPTGSLTGSVFNATSPGLANISASVNGSQANASVTIADTLGPVDITDLTATTYSTTQIRLQWTAPGNDGAFGKAATYEVRRGTGIISDNTSCDAAASVIISMAPKDAGVVEFFEVNGLSPGTTYYFCVRAFDANGNRNNWQGIRSAVTQSSSDAISPSDITTASVTNISHNRVELTFTTVGDDGLSGNAVAYEIRKSIVPITNNVTCDAGIEVPHNLGQSPAGTIVNVVIVNLSELTTYYFCVRAFDDVGNRSQWLQQLSATTSGVLPPARPAWLSATPVNSQRLHLTWGKPIGSLPGQLHYEICRSQTSGGCSAFTSAYSTHIDAESYLVSDLAGDTTYFFSIRAVNSLGVAGPATAESQVTTYLHGAALWARVSRIYDSNFSSVTTDAAGNIYAAGHQSGTTPVIYGTGVSVLGAHLAGQNAVLVKYDNSGKAIWARSTTIANSDSRFISVSTDAEGNVYAVGFQSDNQNFGYGSGVAVSGFGNVNPVVVKYSPSGNALWARSTYAGSSSSYSLFRGIRVSPVGQIFVVGYQGGVLPFYYGPAVSVAAVGGTTDEHAVLVAYDNLGNALWARSVNSVSGSSRFQSVAVSQDNNIYVAGARGQNQISYGAGVSITGGTNGNAVLVKYDAAGTAIWARSTISGTLFAEFYSVDTDLTGNIYTAGVQFGNGSYDYGNAVNLTAPASGTNNPILIKYDTNGNTLWARSALSGAQGTEFTSVKADAFGNIYVVGAIGSGSYSFVPGVNVTGTGAQANPLTVAYDATGTARWARSLVSGGQYSEVKGVTVDNFGNIYIAGFQDSTTNYGYGPEVIVAGGAARNASLIKYAP